MICFHNFNFSDNFYSYSGKPSKLQMQVPQNFGFVKPLNNKKLVELFVEELKIHESSAINKMTEEKTTENTIRFVRMLRPLNKEQLTMIWDKCFEEKTPLMT